MSLADSLQRRWYTPDLAPPLWTLPVAGLYGGVTAVRRSLYRRGLLGATRLPVPVVVVGNLTAGGAGKTPLVIALVEALRARGLTPGVVSRGYGGSAREPCLLGTTPNPDEVGDEPALIRLRTGVPVAVGADRPAAARLLLDQHVDLIIADDGLQHYALARDLEVCVVDGVRRFGNGRLLPAGPLREPASRLQGVDFVVCNGGEPQAGEILMRLGVRDAVSLAEPTRTSPLREFSGTRVHAVAGIGHPQRFFDALRGRGIDATEHAFPDHHRYTLGELAFGDGLPVLMTEKDAIKCRGFAHANWWAVPAIAELPAAFFDAVAARIGKPS
ncbi:MAG: tetraacyldisaccharide 4'-kinase [Rhodanobacteraceae bacterium]